MTDEVAKRRWPVVALGATAAIGVGVLAWSLRSDTPSEGAAATPTTLQLSESSPSVSVVIVTVPESAPASSASASIEPAPDASDATVTSGNPVEAPTLSVPVEAPEQAPAFIVIEGGTVFLRGVVPDEDVGELLLAKASTFGDGTVTNQLTIEAGAPIGTILPLFVPGAALFEADSAKLRGDANGVLDLVAGSMSQQPATRLLIRGHTDDQGSDAYNFALSQQRVAAVFAYLSGAGVTGDRMSLDPKGEIEPIASNSTPEGRAQNRRVELVLVDA